MFRLLTREKDTNMDPLSTMMMMTKEAKDLGSSQTTMELSFLSEDSHDAILPNCAVLTDYESDSLEDLERQDSIESNCSTPRRLGGLRRSTRQHSPQLRVSFGNVTSRTHALCVGDNPAVSLGVPISLDWTLLKEETTTVHDYETDTASHPTGLAEDELAIPAAEREAMVRQAGFTTEDIRSAVRQVNHTKMEREKTIDTLQNASSEEFVEKLKKGVWNFTLGKKSKQKERAMLQQLKERDAKRVLVPPAC